MLLDIRFYNVACRIFVFGYPNLVRNKQIETGITLSVRSQFNFLASKYISIGASSRQNSNAVVHSILQCSLDNLRISVIRISKLRQRLPCQPEGNLIFEVILP